MIYASDGRVFRSTGVAARAVRGIRHSVASAIRRGGRYRGLWWSRKPFTGGQTIIGERDKRERACLIYSDDGRAWINAAFAARRIGVTPAAVTEAARKQHRAAGLRWSRLPFHGTEESHRVAAKRHRLWAAFQQTNVDERSRARLLAAG